MNMNEPMNQTLRMIAPDTFRAATTVVPNGAKLNGTMSAQDDLALRIDGEFKGKLDIHKAGAIHIGPNAHVECETMVADHIYVQGRVRGNIHARKGLELSAEARVSGEVRYDGELDVHPGARISGSVTCSRAED